MGADYKKAHKSMLTICSDTIQHPANTTATVLQGYAANQLRTQTVAPWDGILSALFIAIDNAPGAGENTVYTVLVNGAPTALTCTIAGAVAQDANNVVNQVAVAQGDTIVVRAVSSLNAAAARITGGMGYTT